MCEKLQLVIEEVWSNEDLDALISKYVAFGEWVFATLHVQLDASTFGTTMMRNNAAPDAHDRYVAVIDCRGTKAARRFFTRWHEIAHLLTDATHLALSVRRSTGEASSVERLMDEIAGEIGFYDPIFRLALLDYREPTFDAVKSIRHQFCSHASFQATLIACTARIPWPAINLEARLGYKKEAAEQLLSGQRSLFPIELPQAKLRALVVAPNSAARSGGIRIDRNMEIPAKSAISMLFHKALDTKTLLDASARENLRSWRHSEGLSLNNIEVHIEARQLGDRVFALIRPTPLA